MFRYLQINKKVMNYFKNHRAGRIERTLWSCYDLVVVVDMLKIDDDPYVQSHTHKFDQSL